MPSPTGALNVLQGNVTLANRLAANNNPVYIDVQNSATLVLTNIGLNVATWAIDKIGQGTLQYGNYNNATGTGTMFTGNETGGLTVVQGTVNLDTAPGYSPFDGPGFIVGNDGGPANSAVLVEQNGDQLRMLGGHRS